MAKRKSPSAPSKQVSALPPGKVLHIILPDPIHRQAKANAALLGLNLREYISGLIEQDVQPTKKRK